MLNIIRIDTVQASYSVQKAWNRTLGVSKCSPAFVNRMMILMPKSNSPADSWRVYIPGSINRYRYV